MKWLLFLVFGLAACGPIQTTQAVINAGKSLKEARLQNAYRYAPYEYTKAQLYLRMAKQREGRSDFEVATRYGKNARKYAEQAQKVTKNPKLLKLRRKYDPDFRKLDAQSSKKTSGGK